MTTQDQLRRTITRIDGRGYKAYKDIAGRYDWGLYRLSIDHVQGDPFASPSRIRVIIPMERTGIPPGLWSTPTRRVALGDCISRRFRHAAGRDSRGGRGMGTSGLVDIDAGRQEVLPRTAVLIHDREMEVRFVVGLPAAGRTILSREAMAIFFERIPAVVSASLLYQALDTKAVEEHVQVVEDQEHLRDELRSRDLVAFVAKGAVLPRRSGVDDRPLQTGVIPFAIPPELTVEMEAPNRGRLRGMGIPTGVTLIVGGGFHGKSTLLQALERGVYNHVPRDGREHVVTDASAVKIRAEDGRRIEKVDISPFITNLPFGKDTQEFCTDNASGSTSQAANIMEALETGSRVLLIDEDTSATNFMVRDTRMQELVVKDKEPITPFVDKVRTLHQEHGVSTILVMGGSGDYFDMADTVIMMDTYRPVCVTDRVREIAARHPTRRVNEGGAVFGEVTPRCPMGSSFDASRGKRDVKIDAKGLSTILFGTTAIDLSGLEQLVDMSQTRAIGAILHYCAGRYFRDGRPLKDALDLVMGDVAARGLDCLVPYEVGNLALPRIHEVAGAVNRLRTLQVASRR